MGGNGKRNILIIEDDARLAGLLQDSFAIEGIEVHVANTGDAGLKMALATHPDLLLLDVLLPGMDGMHILHTLRQDPWGKTLPVVMLTNVSADDRIMKEVMHDEPSYYLVKAESTMDDIVNKVRSALNF